MFLLTTQGCSYLIRPSLQLQTLSVEEGTIEKAFCQHKNAKNKNNADVITIPAYCSKKYLTDEFENMRNFFKGSH